MQQKTSQPQELSLGRVIAIELLTETWALTSRSPQTKTETIQKQLQ